MASDQPAEVRAGFWRRWLALLIDGIIISLPFQLMVAILFAATSGRIQQFGGITYVSLENAIPFMTGWPEPLSCALEESSRERFLHALTRTTTFCAHWSHRIAKL
jgi:hypothetical protein